MKRFVILLFFLSGASSLVLETIWFRQLAAIFGASSLATGTVTAAFLGGLGLGGWAATFWVDRLSKRYLAYGLLEIFIGTYALLSPYILSQLGVFQASLLGGDILEPEAFAVLRFAVVFLALLPPTLAMGATLPLLSRAVADREEAIGTSIGSLYGFNTLGAFLGVLMGGFFLLPYLGQNLGTIAGASISLVVGLIALFCGLIIVEKPAKIRPSAKKGFPERRPMRPYALLGVFLILSGLAAMLVQMAYTRVLAVVLGSSVYSFTLTVAVFLAGIGLGSLLYSSLLARRIEPFRILAISQGVLGFFLIVGIQVADRLPAMLLAFAGKTEIQSSDVFLFHAGLISMILLVPTVAMGVSFPAAVSLFAPGVQKLGRDVGRAYFLNAMGSIAGSFLAVIVLIPSLGLQSTVGYAAGLAVVWSALFLSIRQGFLIKKYAIMGLPVALFISSAFLVMPAWDVGKLTSGMYRFGLARKIEPGKTAPRSAILYYRDGPVASVSVERRQNIMTMRINGKVEASNRFDMPTQVMVGLLPILFHSRGEGLNTALMGYGSGVTAGSMLSSPIASLTAVELEPRVIEASHFFNEVNFRPDLEERMKLVVGDARTVLGYGKGHYDVIVSEPSNPWVVGAASLFTVDFYRMMKGKLNEGGIYSQWVQLYELSPEHLKIIVRSFRTVFPHVQIFSASERGADLILLGSEKPWKVRMEELLKRVKVSRIGDTLLAAGLGGAFDVISLLSVTNREAEAFAGQGALNTDDNGLIEFSAPKDMIFYDRYTKSTLDFHFSGDHGHLIPVLDDLGPSAERRAENLSGLSLHLLGHGRTEAAYETAAASLKETVNDLGVEVMEVAEMIYLKPERWPPISNGWLITEKSDERYTRLAMAMADPSPDDGLKLAGELAGKDDDPRLKLIQGFFTLKAHAFKDAFELLRPLADDDAFRLENQEVDFFTGIAADRSMKFQKALSYLARFNLWRKKQELPIEYQPAEGETLEIELETR